MDSVLPLLHAGDACENRGDIPGSNHGVALNQVTALLGELDEEFEMEPRLRNVPLPRCCPGL